MCAQLWLSKGLQSGACRSPRRSKASQDEALPQLSPSCKDRGHSTSRPSIEDLMPDSDSESRPGGEKEAADFRVSSLAGRWGSESLDVPSKGQDPGLTRKGGSLRLVQARTDLADEG